MKGRIALMAAAGVVAAAAFSLSNVANAGTAPNGYPYCAKGSGTDRDGDGWGFENNASCVVQGSRADPAANGGGGGGASDDRGSYTISGLGNRKREIAGAGGNALDIATAMLESDNMRADYPYGDNKTGDAANFGIFKQNWGMLRQTCSRFKGKSAGDFNSGAVLNSNLAADIQCLHESQAHFGVDRWFAGHRNGQTGLGNPNTADIQRYRNAVYWIRDQLTANPANLTNDTRFWVKVPAI